MIETIKIGTLKWHHVLSPSEDDLQFLSDNFHFHPLDLEDCRSKLNQRPKIDTYDDYYFLILHFPNFDSSGRFLKTREVKIFWGDDYIITIGSSHWVVMDMFLKTKEILDKKEEIADLHDDINIIIAGLVSEKEVAEKAELEKQKNENLAQITPLITQAETLIKENKLTEALAVYKQIIEIDPNHTDAKTAITNIENKLNTPPPKQKKKGFLGVFNI